MPKRLKTPSNSLDDIYSLEACNAQPRSGGSKSSVVKKNGRPGKRREARSMGRYPFLAWANRYLESVGNTFSSETVSERSRRYKRMDKDFRSLYGSGKVSTHDPEKMTYLDVVAFVGLLKSRGLVASGILHEVSALNSLLNYVGNGAVQQAKFKMRSSFPKQNRDLLPPMTEDERRRIIETAKLIPIEDWRRQQAYGMTVLVICCGVRSKELRLASLSDLDMVSWTIHAEEVKGKGTYGKPRDVPIDPDGREVIERYVRARKKAVAKVCPANKALFPALGDAGGDGYFTTNSLSKLRAIVIKETGIDFDGRKCRRTFGQKCMDDGLDIDSISVLLGHRTTRTTEQSYCRKRQSVAEKQARKIWEERDKNLPSKSSENDELHQPKGNSPLIENKKWLPGYA